MDVASERVSLCKDQVPVGRSLGIVPVPFSTPAHMAILRCQTGLTAFCGAASVVGVVPGGLLQPHIGAQLAWPVLTVHHCTADEAKASEAEEGVQQGHQ